MIVRSLMSDFIISKTLIIQRISVILFLIVFISIWIEEWDRIISFITRAGLIALILNLTMIFIGYYIAKIFASGIPQRKCISLECGLQNGTLAVFVATQLFDEIVYMVPTAAYALVMFVTSIFFVLIVRKIN
jgi:BASS family bile acid:Na+ symporter